MSAQSQDNNKRIAKNTLALYVRMFFILAINLFTSRAVLDTLGASDFGVYNVVCGVVIMFAFINGTLTTGTQRFLNFSMGSGDDEKMRKTFNTAFLLHLFLMQVVIVLIETAGLWFLNNKLVIPAGKMNDAFWIFQFSVVVCALQITQVPYTACIIAHERMKIYAYMGILDVVMKLVVVFSLLWADVNKLILYGLLLMFVQIIDIMVYRVYCVKNFKESHISMQFEKKEAKEMLVFSGWNIMGCMAVSLNGQGINILLNTFFGPIINAARAISMQVNSVVTQFVGNFQTAVNPQIVKLYAQGEKEQMYHLICNNAKYAAYMMMLLIIPLITEMDYILHLWLGSKVPEHTVVFTQIILIQSLITTISRPLVTGIHAIGKMKIPNLVSGTVLLMIVPVSYLLLYMGFTVIHVYLACLIPWLFELCFCIYFVNRHLTCSICYFISKVLLKVLLMFILLSLCPLVIHWLMPNGLLRVLAVVIIGELWAISIIYKFGIGDNMRTLIKSKIFKFYKTI